MARSLSDRPLHVCPLQSWDAKFYLCRGAYPDAERTCAWWIPGAECCAIAQITRKLNDLVALWPAERWWGKTK